MFRPLLLAVLLVSAAAAQSNTTSYVLAGQSNLAYWGGPTTATGCALARPNVRYIDSAATGFAARTCADPALMELGARLGDADPNHNVRIYQLANAGAAVSETSLILSGLPYIIGTHFVGYWFGNAPVFAPYSWPMLFGPELANAGASAAEVRILWCQGETEMSFAYGTAAYLGDVRNALDLIRRQTGKAIAQTYLITPGLIEVPGLDIFSDQIRDAFMLLPAATQGSSTPCRTVAHHYDIPLAPGDVVHHDLAGYRQMARRAADGIIDATLALDFDGSWAFDTNSRALIKLQLTGTPTNAADPRFFQVTANGTPQTPVVTASGSTIRLQFAAPLPSPSNVTIRHVPGSGFGLGWTQVAPLSFAPAPPTVPVVCAPFALQLSGL